MPKCEPICCTILMLMTIGVCIMGITWSAMLMRAQDEEICVVKKIIQINKNCDEISCTWSLTANVTFNDQYKIATAACGNNSVECGEIFAKYTVHCCVFSPTKPDFVNIAYQRGCYKLDTAEVGFLVVFCVALVLTIFIYIIMVKCYSCIP